MRKRYLLIVLPVVALCLVILAIQVAPVLSASQQTRQPQSTVIHNNLRLQVLNEQLGIPMTELQKMSAEEVQQLIRDRAEELGVVVYDNTFVAGETTPRIVAGSKVRPPKPALDTK